MLLFAAVCDNCGDGQNTKQMYFVKLYLKLKKKKKMLCKVADQGIHIVYKLPRLITNVSRKNIDRFTALRSQFSYSFRENQSEKYFPPKQNELFSGPVKI